MACPCCSNVNCGACNTFKRPLPHETPCFTQAYSGSCVDRPAGYFAELEQDAPCTCEDSGSELCSHSNFQNYDIPQRYKDQNCRCVLRQSQCDRFNCYYEYDEFGTTVTRNDWCRITKIRRFIYVFDNVACVWKKILEAPMIIDPSCFSTAGGASLAVPPDCTPPDCGESFPAIGCTCVNPLP
jgi:hypothetical protein